MRLLTRVSRCLTVRFARQMAIIVIAAGMLAACSADNASMDRTHGAVPDLRCDYGAPCGKTPGAQPEGTISR